MPNLDLTALRSLYEQSTQGEWEATYRGAFEVHEGSVHLKGDELLDALVEQDNNETIRGELHYENAIFCAAAHNSFPQLLAIAEAAEKLDDALNRLYQTYRTDWPKMSAPEKEWANKYAGDDEACRLLMEPALAAYRKAVEGK